MTALDLDIAGHHIRLACTARIARRARNVLADHVIDEPAPLGFLVRPTTLRQRKHVLVDRCGFVLGTARHVDEVLAMVFDHLAALLPLADGRARFRVRALRTGQQVIVCTFPLLFVPPFDESQLLGTEHRLIDRLAIDVDARTGNVVLDQPHWQPTGRAAPGHQRADGRPLAVRRLVVTGGPAATSSRSTIVARVCADSLGDDRAAALDAALALVQSCPDVCSADLSSFGGLRALLVEAPELRDQGI